MYVALNRITSLTGLFLIGEYTKKALKVNNFAKLEYERLKQEQLFIPLISNTVEDKTLILTLFNKLSLNKHAIDIAHTDALLNSDIVCLTETQLTPDQCLTNINHSLNFFTISYNSSLNKYESLAICHASYLEILQHRKVNGLSVVTFRKPNFSERIFTMALLYRLHSSSRNIFYETIYELVNENIDIIMGDFNINALNSEERHIRRILSSYDMVVTEPTHISGSLLDHVYISKSLSAHLQCSSNISTMYFSDHEAVKVSLKYIT